MSKIEEVKVLYSRYNFRYFNWYLPQARDVLFEIIPKNDDVEYLGCTYLNNKNGKSADASLKVDDKYQYVIKMVDDDMDVLKNVLAHEMIHIWQINKLDFDKFSEPCTWTLAHDKSFLYKMNQINDKSKQYGDDLNIQLVGNS